MSSRLPVAIVGGGISGLAAARVLSQRGIPFRIVEKSARVGGVIGSEWKQGYLVEYGPNSFSYKQSLSPNVVESIGANPVKASESGGKNRFIVHKGVVKPLPMSISSFLKTDILSLFAKFRLLREPFIPVRKAENEDEDESIGDFIERRFGREFLNYFINPFIAGVYAGNPSALSTRLCFPDLVRWEQTSQSVMKGAINQAKQPNPNKLPAGIFSFADGMQTMIDSLAAGMNEHFLLGHEIQQIQRRSSGEWVVSAKAADGGNYEEAFSSVIFTAPQYAIPKLLLGASDVESVEYPPLNVLLLGFPTKAITHPLDGFGLLCPQVEKRNILGCIFSSSIFPNRAPEGHTLLTCFIGGSRNPELTHLNDQQIEEIVVTELQSLLGIKEGPVFRHMNRWTQSIPQYHLTYGRMLSALDDYAKENAGLFYAGNYYKGVAVGDAYTSGEKAGFSAADYVQKAHG